jgi:O-methyltransferase
VEHSLSGTICSRNMPLNYLRRAKSAALQKVLFPYVASLGWRPGKAMPLDDSILGKDQGYDDESRIREALKLVRKNSMSSFERMATLWQQVEYLDKYKISGALVECGVWKGGSAGMMALAHLHATKGKPTRALHLFDSFEGLPEPGSLDGKKADDYSSHRMDGKLEAIGKCVGPIEDVKKLLLDEIRYPKELVHFHQGWFQDTINSELGEPREIALLRLDGDWYESTVVCLKHLYPRLVKAGVCVMDDYGHWEGCKRATDEYLAGIREPVYLHHIDYTGRYWIKG